MPMLPFILSGLRVQPLTASRRGEEPSNTHHHSPPVNCQLLLGMAKHTCRRVLTAQFTAIQRSPATWYLFSCTTSCDTTLENFHHKYRICLDILECLSRPCFQWKNKNLNSSSFFLYAKKHRWKTTQKILNKTQSPHFFQKFSSDFSKQLAQHKTILICSTIITINKF